MNRLQKFDKNFQLKDSYILSCNNSFLRINTNQEDETHRI